MYSIKKDTVGRNAFRELAVLTSECFNSYGNTGVVALTNGLRIVTANPSDFKTFKGLAVLSWASG